MSQPSEPPIRVAAVPAAHPYVVAVAPDDGSTLVLPDPIVDASEPWRWWPPAVLDPAWLHAHAAEVDVVHVHFGMESLPEGRLAAALDTADALGIPVVHTVHDLENPQLVDQSRHRRDLDLIVPRARALVTLTRAAADRIHERWGRTATVVPHPTLLEAPLPQASTAPHAAVVGVHMRDLRPSIAAIGTVAALLAALDDLRREGIAAVGRVLVNDRTREPETVATLARMLAGRDDCDLVVRPRPDDAALVAEVDALDVEWLPYGHGTHSGWVELCFDRGVAVVGPGWLPMAQQHPEDHHGFDDLAGATAATRSAVGAATRPGSQARRAVVEDRKHARAIERKGARAAHAELYRAVVPRESHR